MCSTIRRSCSSPCHQFCETFGFREAARFPHVNVNPDRKADRYELSPADREHILGRNAADLEWYHQAVHRLNAASRSVPRKTA